LPPFHTRLCKQTKHGIAYTWQSLLLAFFYLKKKKVAQLGPKQGHRNYLLLIARNVPFGAMATSFWSWQKGNAISYPNYSKNGGQTITISSQALLQMRKQEGATKSSTETGQGQTKHEHKNPTPVRKQTNLLFVTPKLNGS